MTASELHDYDYDDDEELLAFTGSKEFSECGIIWRKKASQIVHIIHFCDIYIHNSYLHKHAVCGANFVSRFATPPGTNEKKKEQQRGTLRSSSSLNSARKKYNRWCYQIS